MAGILICLNGPPRSGKNAIADAMIENLEGRGVTRPMCTFALAEPLKNAAAILCGIPLNVIDDDASYMELKSSKVMGDLTFRELMIKLSEDVVKPNSSHDWWARKTWKSLLGDLLAKQGICFVTDLGFEDEQKFLYEECQSMGAGFLTVHLFREGCDYSIDSRNYRYKAGNIQTLHNDASLQSACDRIIETAGYFGIDFFA
jgi:hypothetical protein